MILKSVNMHSQFLGTTVEYCGSCMRTEEMTTRQTCIWKIAANLLTLILLTWRIGWAPNNASRWQMGFNLVFKGLRS